MRFLMLINSAERHLQGAPPEQVEAHLEAYKEYFGQLVAEGKAVDMVRLRSPDEAKRVQVRGGQRAVFDGPFTEAKEVLGGFCVLEVESEEEAIALAARCPGAADTWVELRRPF